jgi:hypothetical protein
MTISEEVRLVEFVRKVGSSAESFSKLSLEDRLGDFVEKVTPDEGGVVEYDVAFGERRVVKLDMEAGSNFSALCLSVFVSSFCLHWLGDDKLSITNIATDTIITVAHIHATVSFLAILLVSDKVVTQKIIGYMYVSPPVLKFR